MQDSIPSDDNTLGNAPDSQLFTKSASGQERCSPPALPSLSTSGSQPTRKRKRPRPESSNAQKRPAPSTATKIKDSADQDLDRKKNKLGYQRSTIACVPCRRRKIRCVIPDNDRSGKCAHCIRMKKQCSFAPVKSAAADKLKRPEASRKAMSEPSPVHTYYDASRDTHSLYQFDSGTPAPKGQNMVPGLYTASSVPTMIPDSISLLSHEEVDPLTIPQTSQQDTSLQSQHMSSFADHWSSLGQRLDRVYPQQTWGASSLPVLGRQPATNFDECGPQSFPASYSPFPGPTVGGGLLNTTAPAAFSPRSMSQPHNFYYRSSLPSIDSRERGHSVSMPPLEPTPSFDIPSIDYSQANPSQSLPQSSFDQPFDKNYLQAKNPATYLSPLTSTSDSPTSHPSVSPTPLRDTYLSPPTSEAILEFLNDQILTSLSANVADECLQRYYARANRDTLSDKPLQHDQMLPASGTGTRLYHDTLSTFEFSTANV